MFAFILRRLAQAVIVMVSVALIAFMLFQYVGDPVVFLLGQDATAEQVRELRADGRTHLDHMADRGIQPPTSKPASLALEGGMVLRVFMLRC